jgi:hypothetical protein
MNIACKVKGKWAPKPACLKLAPNTEEGRADILRLAFRILSGIFTSWLGRSLSAGSWRVGWLN